MTDSIPTIVDNTTNTPMDANTAIVDSTLNTQTESITTVTSQNQTIPSWMALLEKWPNTFNLSNTRPLKIGIHRDLKAAGMEYKTIKFVLYKYCNTSQYCQAYQIGAMRIDLDGQPAGEVTEPEFQFVQELIRDRAAKKTARLQQIASPTTASTVNALPSDSPLEGENFVPGKLEISIKFNSLPKPVMLQSGAKFGIDADGMKISITLKPKNWKKLTDAATQYRSWVASLTGKMGPITQDGFELIDPAVQVFEKADKKSKKEEQSTATKETSRSAIAQKEVAIPENVNETKNNNKEELKTTDSSSKPAILSRSGKTVTVITKPNKLRSIIPPANSNS